MCRRVSRMRKGERLLAPGLQVAIGQTVATRVPPVPGLLCGHIGGQGVPVTEIPFGGMEVYREHHDWNEHEHYQEK